MGRKTIIIRYTPRVNPKAPRSLQHEKIAYPFFTPLVPIDLVPERGGAAERAGVKPGDRLVAIDGHAVLGYDDFQMRIDSSRGRPVRLSLLRGGKPVEITVTPMPVRDLGEEFNFYLIGVNFSPEPGKTLEVAGVIPGWAAEKAGIRPGDRLIAIDGEKQPDNLSFTKRIRAAKETEVAVTLRRGGEELTLRMTPMKYVPMTIGAVVSVRDYPSPWQQFVNTWEASFKAIRGIFVGIAHKFGFTDKSSPLSPRHLSGPLGMGMVLFNSVRHSTLSTGIYFMVLISFALAIFNLLPLPVLDGGHILFGAIEAVIRRPLPVRMVKHLYIVFATLLIMLMVYVTFFDAKRFYYNYIQPMLKSRPGAAEVKK